MSYYQTTTSNIKTERNIILIESAGIFNEESAVTLVAGLKTEIQRLNGQPFAICHDGSLVNSTTPAALSVINEFCKWLDNQPILAHASVIGKVDMYSGYKQYVPALAMLNDKPFIDRTKAINWLEEQMDSNQ